MGHDRASFKIRGGAIIIRMAHRSVIIEKEGSLWPNICDIWIQMKLYEDARGMGRNDGCNSSGRCYSMTGSPDDYEILTRLRSPAGQ